MIVIVKEGVKNHYIEITENDRDIARQLAFRFIHRRKEQDFNELMHHTIIDELKTIPNEVKDFLLVLR
jgi:hypothetical protein